MSIAGAHNRLQFLDGLRGVAILLVVLFHAFARWRAVVPYGDAYAEFWPAKYGALGVQLFFLISGFVILMTLERSATLRSFASNRWLRLFPAMLLCSMLILLVAQLLPVRPGGPARAQDILPGLLFLHPKLVGVVLGSDFRSLDGAFWSLYVEVLFYGVFGLTFFLRGRAFALLTLALIQTSWLTIEIAHFLLPNVKAVDMASKALLLLGANYFGWFLAGALLYLNSRHPDVRMVLLAAMVVSLTAFPFSTPDQIIATVVVALIFFIPVCTSLGRKLLSSGPLLVVGAASYPLYLLHQNLTISMVLKIHEFWPQIPGFLLPIPPTAVLLLASWYIATHCEPAMKRTLKAALVRVRPPQAPA